MNAGAVLEEAVEEGLRSVRLHQKEIVGRLVSRGIPLLFLCIEALHPSPSIDPS